MKIETLIQLTRNCYPGQLTYSANGGALVYREDGEQSEQPEIDVTRLIDDLETTGVSIDDMLTACSDFLYERLCVDCGRVGTDELEPASSDVSCFVDVAGERICDDCCFNRVDQASYDADPYAYNGVSRSDFY